MWALVNVCENPERRAAGVAGVAGKCGNVGMAGCVGNVRESVGDINDGCGSSMNRSRSEGWNKTVAERGGVDGGSVILGVLAGLVMCLCVCCAWLRSKRYD